MEGKGGARESEVWRRKADMEEFPLLFPRPGRLGIYVTYCSESAKPSKGRHRGLKSNRR